MGLAHGSLATSHLVSRHVLRQGRTLASKRSYSLASSSLKQTLKVSEEVKEAIATNKPVVALESTIYTHGALGDLGLEQIVRDNGGVPAVCGILAGVPTVGLLPHEIDRMVNEKAKKVSRRDIATLTGRGFLGIKEHGGTTISGTMVLARLAGIRVFGTGGLGGVHRGFESAMDVSADLTELGRTRMAVVASGCKGFLDIQRTLEFLETQGVVVSTFLRGRDPSQVTFPGFWATESGLKSPSTVRNEEEAAAIILAQEKLGIESGMVFANPIPAHKSIPKVEMDAIIEQAVSESRLEGAAGNENTPFILKRIRELSEGRSVGANTALVQSNVECATKIARALSAMSCNDGFVKPFPQPINTRKSPSPMHKSLSQADILVAGSVAVDLTCDYNVSTKNAEDCDPRLYTSNLATISQSVGGVGRNVALAAHRLATSSGVRFCSLVGDDVAGNSVIASLQSLGMDVSCVEKLEKDSSSVTRTAEYVAVNGSKKDLFIAMADMDIFSSNMFPESWDQIVAQSKPKWLVVDANWSAPGISSWIRAAKRHDAKVAFEPVSQRVFPNHSVDISTPNNFELSSMHSAAAAGGHFDDASWVAIYAELNQSCVQSRLAEVAKQHGVDLEALQQALQLLPYIPTLITKLGSKGAIVLQALALHDPRLTDPRQAQFIVKMPDSTSDFIGGFYIRAFPPAEKVSDVASVNGVGDTFLGVLVAGLACGKNIENLLNIAQKGAIMTLRSPESVSPSLGALKDELLAS